MSRRPVFEERPQGKSNFVIVVDHAGARIPRALENLGVPAAELDRHIAWDIGSLGLARRMSALLDAPLIAQNYSRLVIDCNRDPGVATSIPEISEWVAIPGNTGCEAEGSPRGASEDLRALSRPHPRAPR